MKKQIFLSLFMLLGLGLLSPCRADSGRIQQYVERINEHLQCNADLFASNQATAPFVMDWSDDLFKKPYLQEETIQKLNEQLSFLAQHTDYRFFVLVTPANPYFAEDPETLVAEIQKEEQAFNKAVYEQSELTKVEGKKIVLLSLVRFEYLQYNKEKGDYSWLESLSLGLSASGALQEPLLATLRSYSEAWLRSYTHKKWQQHYLLRSNEFNGNQYVSSLTEHLYKELPKPLVQRSYYLTYLGEIIELGLQKSSKDVKGHKEIYQLKVIRDSRMHSYADLLKQQKNYREILSRNRDGQPYIAEQFNKVNEQLLTFDERVQEFRPIRHGLKESAVVSGAICRQYVEWYRDRHFNEVDGNRRDYTSSPADAYFVLGKNQIVYEENLKAFDALSALLTPVGLDVVADGFGLLYAGYYGDGYSAAFYVAAVTVPLANKTVLRAVIEGAQHLQKVGNNFELVVKADALYSGLPVRFRQLLPGKVFNKLEASEAKALLDQIKQAKFSDEALKQLGKDLETDQLFELFRQKPETVEAWKGLINQPDWVRKNTKFLEKLSGESEEFIKKVDNFYSTTMKNRTPQNFNGPGPYNKGVNYNEFGFPKLREKNPLGDKYVFNRAKGNHTTDFDNAKEWLIKSKSELGYDEVWFKPNSTTFKVKKDGQWSELLTWHHHENGIDMIPVLTDLHTGLPHVGGVETVKQGINHLFNY